ncbi:MAG: hypothetical protein ABI847_03205 [Anaerolineales bacterium]
MSPKPQSAAQPIRRSTSVPSWVWSIVLLAAMFIALAAYKNAQGAPAPSTSAKPAAWLVQAQPSELNVNVMRPPSADKPAAWLVQAQPSNLNVQPKAKAAIRAIDPAVRSVYNFVVAHGLQYASEAPEVLMDAGALNYTDYLRRHGALPTEVTWMKPIDPQVQALIDRFALDLNEPAPARDSLVNTPAP